MAEKMTIVGAPDLPVAAVAATPPLQAAPPEVAPPPAVSPPDAAPGIVLHKFVKSDSWRGALTPDPTGANLPTHGSPWIYDKEVLVAPGDRRVGATSLHIAAGIDLWGYFLLPLADDV